MAATHSTSLALNHQNGHGGFFGVSVSKPLPLSLFGEVEEEEENPLEEATEVGENGWYEGDEDEFGEFECVTPEQSRNALGGGAEGVGILGFGAFEEAGKGGRVDVDGLPSFEKVGNGDLHVDGFASLGKAGNGDIGDGFASFGKEIDVFGNSGKAANGDVDLDGFASFGDANGDVGLNGFGSSKNASKGEDVGGGVDLKVNGSGSSVSPQHVEEENGWGFSTPTSQWMLAMHGIHSGAKPKQYEPPVSSYSNGFAASAVIPQIAPPKLVAPAEPEDDEWSEFAGPAILTSTTDLIDDPFLPPVKKQPEPDMIDLMSLLDEVPAEQTSLPSTLVEAEKDVLNTSTSSFDGQVSSSDAFDLLSASNVQESSEPKSGEDFISSQLNLTTNAGASFDLLQVTEAPEVSGGEVDLFGQQVEDTQNLATTSENALIDDDWGFGALRETGVEDHFGQQVEETQNLATTSANGLIDDDWGFGALRETGVEDHFGLQVEDTGKLATSSANGFIDDDWGFGALQTKSGISRSVSIPPASNVKPALHRRSKSNGSFVPTVSLLEDWTLEPSNNASPVSLFEGGSQRNMETEPNLESLLDVDSIKDEKPIRNGFIDLLELDWEFKTVDKVETADLNGEFKAVNTAEKSPAVDLDEEFKTADIAEKSPAAVLEELNTVGIAENLSDETQTPEALSSPSPHQTNKQQPLWYLGTWTRLSRACAVELEQGVQVWNEATSAECESELVSVLQGENYFKALVQIYKVHLILRAAVELHSSWLEAPGDESGGELQLCMDRSSEAWIGLKNVIELIGLEEPVYPETLVSQEMLTCSLTLVPLQIMPDVPSTTWNGNTYFSPVANLWANRVSHLPPLDV